MSAHVDRYVAFFEDLTPAALESLDEVFSDTARFVDPFNDVRGRAAIRRVFEHMYATCDAPRFAVSERVCDGATCYLHWTFRFGMRGRDQQIDGVSRVLFGADGRADEHFDYWDPARQVYEQIPGLGYVLKTLRRRLSAPQQINSTN